MVMEVECKLVPNHTWDFKICVKYVWTADREIRSYSGLSSKTRVRDLPFSTAKLDLSYNQIEELPPGVFDNNPELTILYLYRNQIAQLPPGVFSYNTKLIRLDLDDNQIKELPPGVFANNTELTVLYEGTRETPEHHAVSTEYQITLTSTLGMIHTTLDQWSP
ncbi:leucine-rich repeat-containing protein 15-like, partial [Stylophora pistillata]|uniref:leucine-rich repeat-containing protein 15-like n=1 Tax=Stylophora pistillata TaxID=50429 RepID=UPI000C056E9D